MPLPGKAWITTGKRVGQVRLYFSAERTKVLLRSVLVEVPIPDMVFVFSTRPINPTPDFQAVWIEALVSFPVKKRQSVRIVP